MPERLGARLAVPLTISSIFLLVGLDIASAPPAKAVDGCRPTARGVICGFSGSSSTSTSRRTARPPTRRPAAAPLPPLRYLAVSNGRCWYWSRYRPGFDSWNSAYDQSIILTRWRLPQCNGRSAPPPPVVTIDVAARAWSVFRAFPLDPPVFRLTPVVGITNLPSRLHLERPNEFSHGETLPDGRRREVHARVDTVWVEWSDGSPATRHTLSASVGDPGAVRHTYRLKTCPPAYRTSHLDGPKCHPVHERYPVTVTLQWAAVYRAGGSWIPLGTIDRSSGRPYDVDEILGVLTSDP